MQTFSKNFANSLRGIMQLGIISSHLHYVLSTILFFSIANKLGTSIVAMFFFISGFGLMTSFLSNKGAEKVWKGFFTKRIYHICKVLIFITLLYLGLKYLDQGIIPQDILYNLLYHGFTPLPNSWFVFILIVLYIAFFCSFRYLKFQNYKWGLVILTILSLGSMLWCIELNYARAWWITNLAFLSGVLYASFEKEIFQFASKWLGLGLLTAIVAGLLILNVEILLSLAYLFIPIVAIIIGHKVGYAKWIDKDEEDKNHSLQVLETKSKGVLNFFSKISFELYLVHGMMIALLRGQTIYISNDLLYILAVFSSSIIMAYCIHKLLTFKIIKG